MYKLVERIREGNKTVGYVLQDIQRNRSKMRLNDVVVLVASGSVINAEIGSNGKIKGKGVDLRTLPILKSNSSEKPKVAIERVYVEITDADSDLNDAPYKTESGDVYLLGAGVRVICNTSEQLEGIYVAMNSMETECRTAIQNYGDRVNTNEKYELFIKLLHYKPEYIMKFVGKLCKITGSKCENPRVIRFKRRSGKVCDFDIDFKKRSVVRVARNELVMADVEYNLVLGILREHARNI